MPKRGRIEARQARPAPSALPRLQDLGRVALFGWDQRSLVFTMARLPASLPLRRGLAAACRMRMLGARRQRRVLRRLRAFVPLKPLLQVNVFGPKFCSFQPKSRDFRHQQANDRLSLRRPTRDLLFCDFQRHAIGVAKIACREKASFRPQINPGCERLRFHIDHVLPIKHGGNTTLANLCLACVSCSLRKGAKTHAIDPESGSSVPLFDPRRNDWGEHFC